jgi:hypothetical protein
MGARGLWGKQVLYEEAGQGADDPRRPDVPAGVRREPVSHVDVYPDGDAMHGRDAPEASGFHFSRSRKETCFPSTTRPLLAPAST